MACDPARVPRRGVAQEGFVLLELVAAECWRQDGTDDAIRARLGDELEDADLLAPWRVHMAGHDIRGDTDWVRVHDVVTARREYRERSPPTPARPSAT
jgi:hypothetical protein